MINIKELINSLDVNQIFVIKQEYDDNYVSFSITLIHRVKFSPVNHYTN